MCYPKDIQDFKPFRDSSHTRFWCLLESFIVQVYRKDDKYKRLRDNSEVVTQGDVIMQQLSIYSEKFLHKPTVKASANQLKDSLDFMKPRFARFIGALSEGCPAEACDQPASVAFNGFCEGHARRGLAGGSCNIFMLIDFRLQD